jgi:hypothetical protein
MSTGLKPGGANFQFLVRFQFQRFRTLERFKF